jgi:hypothetical protein
MKKPQQTIEYKGFIIKYRSMEEYHKKINKADKKLLKTKWKDLQQQLLIRDNYKCVFCNKQVGTTEVPNFQSCHIIPWEFEDTRYELDNLLLGCFYHHKVGKYSMHNHPVWLVEWLRLNRPNQYQFIISKLKNNEKYD